MECVEASLRLAKHATNRRKFLAFQGSMHGKSLLTATLAGKDFALGESSATSLPYIDKMSEADILHSVENVLHQEEYAALLLEPIQMSSNGQVPSTEFLDELFRVCSRYQTLMIFDEILSGFYRTGDSFFFQSLAVTPHIVLAGKALGNGLPAAALISNKAIDRSALNYRIESTYANHPLACAAISASIEISKQTDLKKAVSNIEHVIQGSLNKTKLSGKGAMWCYKFDARHDALWFFKQLIDADIIVSFFEGHIRLLPSYLIDPTLLEAACKTIRAIDEQR
jgi:acetylornithine/succinyldiaminopimelate/putrescine aminotransferase